MRPLWLGTLGGLFISPIAIVGATLLRYLWPGFPLLRVLDFFATLVAIPIAVVTGQPLVWDVHDSLVQGQVTMLLSYGVVLVAWCTVGGLVVGAVLEQSRGLETGRESS